MRYDLAMVFVALLRGINVGGNNPVPMARLGGVFIDTGFTDVKTYINSGNVIFRAAENDGVLLARRIQDAIETEFGFAVPVVLRSLDEMEAVVAAIPPSWVNDAQMRCDVMFLWAAIDSPGVVDKIPHKPGVEDLVYFPGAVVWRVDRDHVRQGAVPKMIGSDTYRQMTIRNVNTTRTLLTLMRALDA